MKLIRDFHDFIKLCEVIDDNLAKGKKYTPEEVELSARMMTAWSEFARTAQT